MLDRARRPDRVDSKSLHDFGSPSGFNFRETAIRNDPIHNHPREGCRRVKDRVELTWEEEELSCADARRGWCQPRRGAGI
jgi:hypothetical protein